MNTVAELVSKINVVTIITAIDLVRSLMELVEKEKIAGADKSTIVIAALNMIVTGNFAETLPLAVLKDLKLLIDSGLIQPMINVICDASRGKLSLNEVETYCTNFRKYFCRKS